MQIVLVDGASRDTLREACLELLKRASLYGEIAPLHCFRVQWLLNFHHTNRGELRLALPNAQRLLALAERIGEPGIQMEADRLAALSHLYAGQIGVAIHHYERALHNHDPVRDREHRFDFGSEPGVAIRAQLAVALTCAGEHARAQEFDDAAVHLAKDVAHPHSIVHALSFSATRLAMMSMTEQARTRLGEVRAISNAQGFAYWAAWNGITEAVLDARELAIYESLPRMRSAGERYSIFGARQGLAFLDLEFGARLIDAGRYSEAVDYLAKSLRIWRSSGLRLYEPQMKALLTKSKFYVNPTECGIEKVRKRLQIQCRRMGANGIFGLITKELKMD